MLIIAVVKSKKGKYFAIRKHNDFNLNREGTVFLSKQRSHETLEEFEERMRREVRRRHIPFVEGLDKR